MKLHSKSPRKQLRAFFNSAVARELKVSVQASREETLRRVDLEWDAGGRDDVCFRGFSCVT